MLERIGEGRQLAGRVGVALEERAPVERAEPHGGVLERRGVVVEAPQARLHELGVLARLGEMVREDVLQLGIVDELRRTLEQADRLLLDRVRIREVLRKEGAHVVSRMLAQGRVDGGVDVSLERLHHRAFLARDARRRARDVLRAGAVRDPPQQLVRRELEPFEREGVREQLAGRVRLQAREEQKALAADAHHDVLHLRGLGVSRLQQLPRAALVPFGLRQVVAEGLRRGSRR